MGEVPYRAEVVDAIDGGIEIVVVLEDIGSPEDEPADSDADTAYVPQGAMVFCRWLDDERHVTTGRRMLRVATQSQPFPW